MIIIWQVLVVICLTRTAVATFYLNENLVAVVQLFRHGHRTPTEFYTNDPYKDKIYWGGLGRGQLTREGKRQQYLLGQFTRQRYGGWLSSKYNRTDFYARTTDVERTHMSALSNIYGLYPATVDQMWHPISDWQPIPVHTANPEIFSVLPPLSCKSYYVERANFLAGNESLTSDESYSMIYKYIAVNSGNNITSYTEVHDVFDCLESEQRIGLPLPNWAKEIYPQPISYLDGLYFDSFSHSVKLQRLGIGGFLFRVLEYFDEIIADPNSSQKFQMFSGHDYNLAGVLNAFGAYSPPYAIPFASSIYFELKKNIDNHYVTVWVKENDNFEQISINGCNISCPLNEVKKKLEDISIDIESRNTECQEDTMFINKFAEDIYNAYYNKYIYADLNKKGKL